MYQLVVVETIKPDACIAETTRPIYTLGRDIDNRAIDAKLFENYELHGCKSYCDKPLPMYIKSATDGEIKRWPELSQWRNKSELELIIHKPLTLWVRIDLLYLVPENK
jgi:hypothetical protein